ncbi:tetratricopeptide repeat protein [Polaromonas sp. YR568]|uniref:O-linked N-acetylglucosamine transferase, SPINDLY family protein n=1 Tax=Polaromonas sp. YR568 TaxID=1855301 RepID=UPI00398BD0FA
MHAYVAQAQSLARSGDFLGAAELCRKAIKYSKDVFYARGLLADCLHNQGIRATQIADLTTAEEHFRAALKVQPRHMGALCNLGSALFIRGEHGEAAELFGNAIKIEPENVGALESLAKLQEFSQDMAGASKTLNRLAQVAPENAMAYLLRQALLIQKIAPSQAYIAEARADLANTLQALEAGSATIADPLRCPSTHFPLSYHGVNNKDLVERIAQLHLKAAPSLAWVAPHTRTWAGPRGRIRVGFASAFFYEHSIGNVSRGLIKHIDRSTHEVFVIRLGSSPRDPVARLIDSSADAVVTVSHNLQAARETIAGLGLDVLFFQDIGMEPLSLLLAFSRLAPVQLTSFGHPDTTGIPNLDYVISSENYEIEGAQDHYSERLIQLPAAGTLAYYYRPPPPPACTREDFGFTASDRIYACPQTLYKMPPAMDALFKGILEKDAAAKIVVVDTGQETMRPALERRWAAAMPAVASRIVFLQFLTYERYLGLINCADVVLDTLHFNGQNTSLEIFAMDVPIVTMPGVMQRERYTYGMYLAMEFMELVANSAARYIDIAVQVANDSGFRSYCSARIHESSGVLFENRQLVRSYERAFSQMLDERLKTTCARV